jgi:uncharacterized membrane protein
MNSSGHRWITQLRNGLCVLWLLAFALSEGYSAAATALDHSTKFPSWERRLGWFLLVLPCELLIALILLIRRNRAGLGFRLVALNLIVYAAFMCLDVALVHESLDGTMFAVAGLWAIFFALAVGAARLLIGQAPRHDVPRPTLER